MRCTLNQLLTVALWLSDRGLLVVAAVAQDPTLATTHQEFNSSAQCVVAHWSTDEEAYLAQMYDKANRSRFTASNAPIVEFHGSIDGTINISHARDAQAHYATTGVAYKLHGKLSSPAP